MQQLQRWLEMEWRATYRSHQDGSLVNLMPRVFQVRNLLVHAINDFEVSLLLTLVQALQIGWLGLSLRQEVLGTSRGTSSGGHSSTLGHLALLSVLHAALCDLAGLWGVRCQVH